MLKKPLVWIGLAVLSIVSGGFVFTYFSRAFPIVTLQLHMDRQTALQSADSLAQSHGWGPEPFRQAASFRVDREVQNFVELEAGGTGAFRDLIRQGIFSPYTWRVRHFQEGETNETLILFTPEGHPYGFREKLPEDEPGPALSSDSAHHIARESARDWRIAWENLERVETSQEQRPGGRIDHTFVYERTDARIGEGRYRLKLVVSGDKLTELTRFIKIPEAFTRRHEEMRSANTTIASMGLIVVAIIYVLGGCVVGLFSLLKQRWIIWRKPLIWGLSIAFLQVLAGINEWPLAWMDYDTAISPGRFLATQIVLLIMGFFFLAVLITLSFMAAEGLSRKAFPHHIQLWKLWSRPVAATGPVLGRTVGAYLLVTVFWAFEVALYFLATRVLNWWTPSEALFQPDVLATYFPWLSSIAVSAQAGFWEESLFRAVPIAGAALLGDRFGNRKAWIAGAFVLQAVVFGSLHANYPTQPAYARLVELIIPSLGFGLLYLAFGLLPAVILHFSVDVVAFALPLFVSSAPGIWVHQLLVVTIALVPLWVVLIARVRSKRWLPLPESAYNRAWTPPPISVTPPQVRPADSVPSEETGWKPGRMVPLAGVAGFVLWLVFTPFHTPAPGLEIDRNLSRELALDTLSARNVELPPETRILSRVEATLTQQYRFVWQEGGRDLFHRLLDIYLPGPHWVVRFARFEGDVAERAEEYRVSIAGDGTVFRIRHQLPESAPGARLPEDQARPIARRALRETQNIDPDRVKEISAVESTLPARTDWLFTFADTAAYPLDKGEARINIEINGDRIGDSYRYVHVPETWSREEKSRRNLAAILGLASRMGLVVLFLAGVVISIIRWSKTSGTPPGEARGKGFSFPVFLKFSTFIFALTVFDGANRWPSVTSRFVTSQPLSAQILVTVAFSVLAALFLSVGLGLIIAYVHSRPGASGPRTGKGRPPVMWGVAVGAAVAGIAATVSALAPSLAPRWPSYAPASTYVPLLGTALGSATQTLLYGALFLLIFRAAHHFTHSGSRRKAVTGLVWIFLGIVIAGSVDFATVPQWVAAGLVAGATLFLAYRWVFQYGLSLVPPAVATLTILGDIREGILQPYSAALPGALISLLVVGGIGYGWWKALLPAPGALTEKS
ncbi:MAG: lysostaphin resistance A-like protein [Fidelibacterota bacterium]